MDTERLDRARAHMEKAGIDALVCRLGENVLYLTGYWPVVNASVAVFTRNGEMALLMQEEEVDYAGAGWVGDIRTYRFGDLTRTLNLNDKIAPLLKEYCAEKGLNRATIGYEGSFETVACMNTTITTRIVSEGFFGMLRAALPGARFVDATPAIMGARRRKSKLEVEKHRIAQEVACLGYEAAREAIRPGATEAEVAAAVECRIHAAGVGYKGTVERARGFAFVMSGANSWASKRPFCFSTPKRIEAGETVLVELDTYVDGYQNDLTRTYFVGEPTRKARDIEKAVMAALKAVEARLQPGVPCKELWTLQNRMIEEMGWPKDPYMHPLGHGIGYQFNEPPHFHPYVEDVLAEGDVFALEPAIYIPGWGGIREEDNYLCTAEGGELLTPYPQGLILAG